VLPKKTVLNINMKNKAFTVMELLIVVAIIAILGGLVVGGAKGCSQSEGSRVGIISKISKKGVAMKSWEGDLLLGTGNSTTVWSFSVDDEAVVKQIQEAMRSGKRVELTYEQSIFKIATDTTYNVTKVTVLEK
jgi:prepilin-type N-terminal cleavage/methylation domain-containing protein